MPTAAKEEVLSASSRPCVFFPLAVSSTVSLKTRVWGSSEKMLHCFSATAPLSGNSRRGWQNCSGKTTAGSALDANGNTTSKTDSTGTTTYSWDFENRLTNATLPGSGGTVTFKYDPFGRRIEKISPSTISIFSFDGDNLVETVNASGGVVARYTRTQNMDEPLVMLRGVTTDYYEQDGLGSITSLSDTTGALAQTYTYDSFGNTTNSSGSLTNFFRYTGRDFDTETMLYFMRARYFDPASGRFLNEDPVGFIGGFDFYVYVNNDPNDSTDPSGLAPNGTCGPPCSNVPQHPSSGSVYQNMWQSQENGYHWWYVMVSTNRGPWDYKWYQGKPHPEYDNFGNFNYGATGCAMGIPLNVLLRGAGYAKSRQLGASDPYGSPLGRFPYGNQPDKQQQIMNGYNFCKKCMPADGGFGGQGGQTSGPTGGASGGGGGPF
jgi:RHS repeat-associated protein